jgi:chromate transporter
MHYKSKLVEVATVFFKLGCFAFGGPAVHIAMMEDEIVRKRKWMSSEHFLDYIGATNLIPGPNSTEMTMHCGYERAGKLGLFVAGICFVSPAIFITGSLAWLYVEYGELPEVAPFVYGIQPIVLAIILSAVMKLGKKALKTWEQGILGALVLVTCYLGVHEILALFMAGVLGILIHLIKKKKVSQVNSLIFPLLPVKITNLVLSSLTTTNVFWVFLKVGAVLYGSGYVLFAYLDAELVAKGWLTRTELIDAIAVGQFTPGPVLSTATFVGYQLTGFWGAIMASIGIFLPSFLFVLLLNPLLPKMLKSKVIRSFLDAVNSAAIALMIFVLLQLAQDVIVDWKTSLITIIGLSLTFLAKKFNMMYTILIGAALGCLLQFL